MEFICTKHNLEKIVTSAERFTGKNLTLPVLVNFLLEFGNSKLRISATNLEYAIQADIPGKGSEGGKICIPAKIFTSFIQSIPDEKVILEEKGKNLNVKTDSRTVKINSISAEEFPLIPKIKKTASFSADAHTLQSALEKVLPAVSNSEFKPELTGVFFKVSAHSLFIAATDTFRLAEKKINTLQNEKKETFSFILPARAAQEICRLPAEEDEDLHISIGDNQAEIETGGIKVISRLIEGNFPEYTSIIPKDFEVSGFLKKHDLSDAIRAGSIFSSKLQDIGLHLSGKGIEVKSANADVGEFNTKVSAAFKGRDLAVNFNHRYLSEGLAALGDEEIFFGLNGENKPSLLHGKNDDSFLYVLMPIRLA